MSVLAPKFDETQSATIEAPLRDGSIARVNNGILELHDSEGRLLLRYADGNAEISAPNGDLVLAAPRGRVEVRSAEDVRVVANRDIICSAQRDVRAQGGGAAQLHIEPEAVHVATPKLSVDASHSRLTSESVDLFARQVASVAQSIVTRAEHYEVDTQRLVEKAKDAFIDVQDLLQQRVGRARSIVKDVFTIRSRRTVMESTEDTSIDGERILLG